VRLKAPPDRARHRRERGGVSKYCALAQAAGLTWSAIAELSDTDIEQLLQPSAAQAPASARIEPDYAHIHQQLKHKGVTLMLLWHEYLQAHPAQPTYRYTQFTQRYREFAQRLKRSMRQVHLAGEKLFADYAGQSVPVCDAASGELAFTRGALCLGCRSAATHPDRSLGAVSSWLSLMARAGSRLPYRMPRLAHARQVA
jgi:transposase